MWSHACAHPIKDTLLPRLQSHAPFLPPSLTLQAFSSGRTVVPQQFRHKSSKRCRHKSSKRWLKDARDQTPRDQNNSLSQSHLH